MPKMKTKRAAAKRFKITANGKIKIKMSGLRHILTKKSRKLKRGKRGANYVHQADEKQLFRTLPYAGV
ncbi:MAG: 50S ribosomal protein L35 [Bacteriovoracaceae bacterium]|nr:50S ribosomal protein L35 [Bacteriovoracaceae bacterium]